MLRRAEERLTHVLPTCVLCPHLLTQYSVLSTPYLRDVDEVVAHCDLSIR